MSGLMAWLDGKKQIMAGLLVAVIGGLGALGVKLPFDPSKVTVDSILTFLGVVVMVFRMFSSKPGVLASSPAGQALAGK